MQTININYAIANMVISNVIGQTMVDKDLLLDNEEFMGVFTYELNQNNSIEDITATLIDFVANNY
jgi:hypothetical protein